jgi:hypothetical protein
MSRENRRMHDQGTRSKLSSFNKSEALSLTGILVLTLSAVSCTKKGCTHPDKRDTRPDLTSCSC